MLRGSAALCRLVAVDNHLLGASSLSALQQKRFRRRTLTPPPWQPQLNEPRIPFTNNSLDPDTMKLLEEVKNLERRIAIMKSQKKFKQTNALMADVPYGVKRVGLVCKKLGMMPQWTEKGERIVCTLLHVQENHVVNTLSPQDWYRKGIVGRRKAFNRLGPMWNVTVGAIDADPEDYTYIYRRGFEKAEVPVKKHLMNFMVSEMAVPPIGIPLDVQHFRVGQYVTATGKSIDWGFQGVMHRWGMRGQPKLKTTKSHRRVGSIGSKGDARVWPGRRLPGHMGYEWVTVSGLKIIRMNISKQIIYVQGSVPGDVGEIILLKDCAQDHKRPKTAWIPTWTPTLESIAEETKEETESEQRQNEAENVIPSHMRDKEVFMPGIFRFTSPSIQFTDDDIKKSTVRDKTKAKIAKVKK